MVFSSFVFLFRFLPAFMLVYMICPGGWKNLALFLGSLIFYAWGEPVYIALMLFSALLDYGNGIFLEKFQQQGKTTLARAVLTESVLVNLSLLGIFKYSGTLPLPIGISFYTFQTMSYTIDVYRGQVKAQRSFAAFGAYVSMFPQLIAGPVVRYKDVEKELESRNPGWSDGAEGIGRFCIGLGKKVLLANQIGLLWETISSMEQPGVLMSWIGSLSYALQLYYDFSGYSDMAIGLGGMLGFHLKENFDYPYRSKSITEFWRRWHISLGQWFRDYVYIPLGGSRKGLAIQIRNILIVWALTGIWHGRGLNFLVWGLYFGVLLVLEKCVLLDVLQKLPAVCGHIYTMTAVLLGMTVFSLDHLRDGLAWIGMMFGSTGSFFGTGTAFILSNYGILLATCVLGAVGAGKRMGRLRSVQILVFFLSVIYLVDATYNPFLYFRF